MIDPLVIANGMFSPQHPSSRVRQATPAQRQPSEDPVGDWQLRVRNLGQQHFRAAAESADRLSAQFVDLKSQWKAELGNTSSPAKAVSLPAYREIVAMGPAVLPYILADLEREPDLWFAALREITGKNPVPIQSVGKLAEMAKAWIDWGRTNNVRW